MVVRPDNRLEDGPMEPVNCAGCGADVDVRKSSWQSTSIQWHDNAVATCREHQAFLSAAGEHPGDKLFLGCSALAASIVDAAMSGKVHVQQVPTDEDIEELLASGTSTSGTTSGDRS